MKQIYLLLIAVLIGYSGFSQLVISGDGNGTVTFSYGASSDWSLYDSFGEDIYLYLWVEDYMNSQSTFYGDDWNGTLVHFPWDGGAGAHIVSVNFNTYNWNTGGIIPTATSVTNFNIILRNSSGGNQSGNLLAGDYGYATSVLPIEDFEKSTVNIFVANDKIHLLNIASNEDYKLSIFDTMGRQVKNVTSNADMLDVSELNTALYFLVLETSEGNVIRKKILKY